MKIHISPKIALISLAILFLLTACASSNNRAISEFNAEAEKRGYVGNITREVVGPIILKPAGSYTFIDSDSENAQSKKRFSVKSDYNGDLIREKMLVVEDGIAINAVIERYSNRMIRDFEIKVVNAESGVEINVDEKEFGVMVQMIASGYKSVGDYALGVKLTPGDTNRCLAEEIMFEGILEFIYESAGGDTKKLKYNSSNVCEYIGVAVYKGKKVAIFNEAVQVEASAPGLAGRTKISGYGWRMIDIENGLVVKQVSSLRSFFNGNKIQEMTATREIKY